MFSSAIIRVIIVITSTVIVAITFVIAFIIKTIAFVDFVTNEYIAYLKTYVN